MVHRPDLAHERLSPSNCRELLFDDVMWVRRARQEFDALVELLRERGVEVLLFGDLLTQTLARADGREWLLSRRLRPEETGTTFAAALADWMGGLPADELATRLIGGVTVGELPDPIGGVMSRALAATDFVIAPLPNHLLARDSNAWIYDGVMIAAMQAPARRREALNVEAVYRFHPRFRDSGAEIWFGGFDHDWGCARIEGGDVMPAGDGVVLVGSRERSNAAATSILAQRLFEAGRARLVIGGQMRQGHAAAHLDTVFTFCDRDVVTINEPAVSAIRPVLYVPDGDGGVLAASSERSFLDEVREALGLTQLMVVATGGDELDAERSQWDDGNNVVALAPGSVIAYERNEATNHKLAKAGIEVHTTACQELGRGRRGGHRLTCPISRDP
jgi:arginine deiminase